MTELSFPPLFSGMEVKGQTDPFDKACTQAMQGCDAGIVVYNLGTNELRAALIFAPDVPLHQAMVMLPLCGVGFQNALGALAPPEVAVHLEWSGALRINGASCGRLRTAAATTQATEEPEWLVVGLELPLWPQGDDPGATPDETALYAEGCADVQAPELLESWVKHTLNWINRWADEGSGPLHKEWRGLAYGIGEPISHDDLNGTFLGVDEDFGLLIRDEQTTHLVPLSTLLEER